ncbi:AAA family ATPase [Halohasta litorea]|uniref:AAA family ATPase n=1 Tax=Halohasta litorea TaxID=869891 RepID=A0ABD6D9H5_9EURY|nr:AAA family ATPase [Halohasta litorea]
MISQYSEANLDVDSNKWYCTQFFVEHYRQDVEWDDNKLNHDQTAKVVRKLLSTYIQAGVFSDSELTALKSVTQISSTIGTERTIEQIRDTRGDAEQIEEVIELIEDYGGVGIVGGTAYHAAVPDSGTESQLLSTFKILLETDAEESRLDAAVEDLLELSLHNIGIGTESALLSLLHPQQYPIINEQSVSTLKACLGLDISTSTTRYLDTASIFKDVQQDFNFDPHLRHLDFYCYWANEQSNVTEWFQQNDIAGRDVWQLNAGHESDGGPDVLWPAWKELGVCSIGWDIGDLSDLSSREIETATEDSESEEAGDYLNRFKNKLSPGTIVIAKDGGTLLGIGVVQRPGYHYLPEYLNDHVPDVSIGHPHLYPVDWVAVPTTDHPSVSEWDIDTGLLARKTLVRTTAFEPIRCVLAEREPELLSNLVDIEKRVANPGEHVLSSHKYDSIKAATEDVLTKLGQNVEGNILSTELVTENIEQWSRALSGIEPNTTITVEKFEQCERILNVYDELEDELIALADQHNIGSINRASPPETVFLALGRDLQSRAGVRVNLNQVKWGVLQDGAYDIEGRGRIEPPSNPPTDSKTIAKQLEDTGQLVFYGPPGTGKTYTAQQFSRWWITERTDGPTKDEQLELTTFHPSFSYEDFIEGLTAKERDGAVEYVVEPGVFKQICKRAERAYRNSDSPENAPPYVLIIDEINRGNLAQIFGELMTLLEFDKRLDAPNEARSSLAHSSESFVVPPNLYLIGTMNTADESIALLDAALRRRFRFYGFPPDFEKIVTAYDLGDAEAVVREGGSRRDQLVAASILALEELNTRIRSVNQLGKGKQIGHSHLFGHDRATGVTDTWRFDMLPQLEDYYFGKFDRLKQDLFDNVAIGLIDWDEERIVDFSTESLYQDLCSIAGISEYAALEQRLEPDGAKQATVDDAWAAGERTPATFKERIEQNAESPLRERLLELWEIGNEIGELDAGRGEVRPSVNVEMPGFDSNVGLFEFKEGGKFSFRWNWLMGKGDLTREDIESFRPILETIDPYWIEWGQPDDPEKDPEFEYPYLYLDELSDRAFEQLTSAVTEIVEQIQTETVNGEN